MQLTIELPGWQFAAAGYPSLRPGSLITVIPDGGAVTFGEEGGLGQLHRAVQGKPRLVALAPGVYALAGVVTAITDFQVDDDTLLEFEVDCGLPVRFTCLPDNSELPMHGLWVSGLVVLTAVMAESDTRLLGQPLTAIVQEIQQCCLRSTEETFGNLQALAELAPLPFGPDLVYVTLHGRGGNL
ncbi:MAG: hypothetical protein WAV74_19350 [Anaerolineae bacterium]